MNSSSIDISRYRIGRVLGCGFYGCVMQATDTKTKEVVAIKFVLSDPSNKIDRGRINTLITEYEIVNWLNRTDPRVRSRIPEYIDFGEYKDVKTVKTVKAKLSQHLNDGISTEAPVKLDKLELKTKCHALIMRYIPGMPLSNLAKNGKKYSGEGIQKLFLYLMKTLAILHEHGIAHTDVALRNIMFSPARPSFILIDFGRAYFVGKVPRDIKIPKRTGFKSKQHIDVSALARAMGRLILGKQEDETKFNLGDAYNSAPILRKVFECGLINASDLLKKCKK